MIEFLKIVPVEIRLTVGSSWDNFFFSCKGPLLRKLAATDFRHRGCEDSFSRNILMFNQNMEHVNLRATFGASRDFDCDTSSIKDLQQIEMGNFSLQMAPQDYYSQKLALNSLPMSWFNKIMGMEKEIDPSKMQISSSSPNIRKNETSNQSGKNQSSAKKVTFPRSVSVPKPPLVTHDERSSPVVLKGLQLPSFSRVKPERRPKHGTPQHFNLIEPSARLAPDEQNPTNEDRSSKP